jgi:hypothetical protein
MINDVLQFFTGTNSAVVVGIFKALLMTVALPLFLFFVKSWHSETVKRRDRRRAMYADALAACMEYREFPYVIYRRNGEKPAEERTRISEALREVQKRIAQHRAWLKTESKDVAEKYEDLVTTLKAVAGEEMKRRWADKPIEEDAAMTVVPKMDWHLIEEKEEAYLKAVRKQLAPVWKRLFMAS